jgi:hypothetical protein
VASFLEDFGEAFIPRVIGISDEDDFIDNDDDEYVMDAIREKYLTDSTVTIVLIGACTWARRFVDWESYSTLRNDRLNRRSGLMAVSLKSIANASTKRLPSRLDDNVQGKDGDAGYARWWKYPTSTQSLKRLIETAFKARTEKADLIENSRARKRSDSSC